MGLPFSHAISEVMNVTGQNRPNLEFHASMLSLSLNRISLKAFHKLIIKGCRIFNDGLMSPHLTKIFHKLTFFVNSSIFGKTKFRLFA